MSPALGALLMALVGAQLALQAPVNRRLARASGPVGAAFVNFLVGAVLLFAACAIAGQLDGLGRIGPDWWHALGGCLGAVYVLTALVVVRSIGASGVAAGTVTGQLLTSVLVDAGGWIGVEQCPIDARVVVGTLAVLAGTYLVAGLPRRQAGPEHGASPIAPLASITCAAGLLGIQIPLNALLADSTGDLASGLLNFLVGGTVLAIAVLVTGSAAGLPAASRVRWRYLCGGLFGAVNALTALALVSEIGAGTVAAAAISGQMLASLAIDRVGLLGLEPRPLNGRRLAGAALLVTGTVLVAR